MKKLPIGIQTFAKIKQGNYCYADKSPLVVRLVEEGEFYFLSRPRRFGKSLLIDTIAEAFAGNKKLFSGLYLENNWNWKEKFPVMQKAKWLLSLMVILLLTGKDNKPRNCKMIM